MKTILVVDDEYAIVEVLADALEMEGYDCVTAANGREGLDRIKERQPDLVVTDLMMPLMDGKEMIERMRQEPQSAGIPVLIMSAAARRTASAAEPDSASTFLKKPFELDEFMRRVRSLVGQ